MLNSSFHFLVIKTRLFGVNHLLSDSVKFGTKCFTSDSDDLLAVDGEAMAVLPSLYLRQQLNQVPPIVD
jgi:hypothetical protein